MMMMMMIDDEGNDNDKKYYYNSHEGDGCYYINIPSQTDYKDRDRS